MIFSDFVKHSPSGQVKHVAVINRLCTFVLSTIHAVLAWYLWKTVKRLYGFMTGYSVYQIGHPFIDNCGVEKMRWCFRRKHGHEMNCLGAPETVPTPKVKSQTYSVKRSCLFVMLHIALSMTTKALNSLDCEPLELTYSATITQISRDGRHALNETRSVVKLSRYL